jgi:hypothetical protein
MGCKQGRFLNLQNIQVLDSPSEFLPAFDKALEETAANLNPEFRREANARFCVGHSPSKYELVILYIFCENSLLGDQHERICAAVYEDKCEGEESRNRECSFDFDNTNLPLTFRI